jgi:glycosyltransferase involved in cell wall biosynthesis
MDTKKPLISIVTPSLNQGRFIEETIRSVIDQDYPKFEHIVIDGCSTDNTIEILKRYPHLVWISERDHGQADAVNKGLAKAQGDIIGWINSDDTFLPDAFEVIAGKFQADAQCSVVFGDHHAVDENGSIIYSTKGFVGSYREMIQWWKYTYAIHQPTVFIRKEVLNSIGSLDETYHFAMDYEWWLRISQRYVFYHIPQYIATYRMHKEGKTFEQLELNVYPEQYRASKKHWGKCWHLQYWQCMLSYQKYLLQKPRATYHHPSLDKLYTPSSNKPS